MNSPAVMPVIGRLLPNNSLFEEGDRICNMYQRHGVFDVDSEELCHKEIANLICEVPGCSSKLTSVMELELHYNSVHRYTCATCRKSFASAHLLDLHIEETHDSFFAVLAERKPMYRCLVENCSERFTTSQERQCHCVDCHAFPPNFRWITPKTLKPKHSKSKTRKMNSVESPYAMDDSNSTEFDTAMDVAPSLLVGKAAEAKKPFRGFVSGRGNKKTFSTKSREWHQIHASSSNAHAGAFEGSLLSTDLMNSLPSDDMNP